MLHNQHTRNVCSHDHAFIRLVDFTRKRRTLYTNQKSQYLATDRKISKVQLCEARRFHTQAAHPLQTEKPQKKTAQDVLSFYKFSVVGSIV